MTDRLGFYPGEWIVYDRPAVARWQKCRFSIALQGCEWDPWLMAAMVPEWENREAVELGADGQVRPRTGVQGLNPLEIAIYPEPTSDHPAPATMIVAPDALDRLGLRATVNGKPCNVLSPEGRRRIVDGPRNGIVEDVAAWAVALGEREPDQLPPRFAAGLLVEKQVRWHGSLLPPAVTADGLARWDLVQKLRAELDDAWFPEESERVLRELAGRDETLLTGWDVYEGFVAGDASIDAGTVFEPLTTTWGDSVVAARFQKRSASIAEEAESHGWETIVGGWAAKALEQVRENLARATEMPQAEEFTLMFLTRPYAEESSAPATDMLLIEDRNATHACVWPTWQRQPTLCLPKVPLRALPTVSAIEIPSWEMLMELAVCVHEHRQEALQEREASPAPLPAPAM